MRFSPVATGASVIPPPPRTSLVGWFQKSVIPFSEDAITHIPSYSRHALSFSRIFCLQNRDTWIVREFKATVSVSNIAVVDDFLFERPNTFDNGLLSETHLGNERSHEVA